MADGYTGQLVALDVNTPTQEEAAQGQADQLQTQSQLARATMPAKIAQANLQTTGLGLENQSLSIANQTAGLTLQQQQQVWALRQHMAQTQASAIAQANTQSPTQDQTQDGSPQLAPAPTAGSAASSSSPLAGQTPTPTPKPLPSLFDPRVQAIMQSIDPDDPQAAQKWDAQMRALGQEVPQANQFVGNYSPDRLRSWRAAIGTHAMNSVAASPSPLASATPAPTSPPSASSPLAASSAAPGGAPTQPAAWTAPGSPGFGVNPLTGQSDPDLVKMAYEFPEDYAKQMSVLGQMKYQQTGDMSFLARYSPEVYAKVAEGQKNLTDAQKTAVATQFNTIGQEANAVLSIAAQYGKDAPETRSAYNASIVDMANRRWIDQATAQRELTQPIDFAQLAYQAVRAQTVTEAMTTSGQTAANEARARNANLPPDTEAVSGMTDANGQPIFFNKNAVPPGGYGGGAGSTGAGAAPGGPSTSLASFAGQVAAHESGGSATAQNPRSSATGAAQFTNSTWLQTVAANRPDLVDGKTAAQIAADPQLSAKVLAMRNDPNLSQEMTIDLAKTNGAALQAMNVPVTGATLGAAHALGIDNLSKVLHATPDTPLSQVLPPSVISANPQMRAQTAGAFMQGMVGTYGNAPIPLDGSDGGGLTGQAYLATLNPAMRNQVQAVMDGRLVLPNSGRLSPQQQAVMTNVQRTDPTFDFVNAPARAAVRRDFTSGKSAQAVTSYNTAIGHLDQMDQAINALGNTPFSWWNKPAQWLGQNVGDPHTQAAIANFNTTKGAVTSELVKALRGTGGAEADIQYWQKLFDTADSPVSLHEGVRQAAHLLGSRIDAMTQQYNTGMGLAAQFPPGLTPQAVTSLRRLQSGSQTQTASSAPVTATGPNGQKVQWDGQQWRPVS